MTKLLPRLDELAQVVFPDCVSERRLGCQNYGLVVVLDLERRPLRVVDHPERDGVHIDRNGIAVEAGFGPERCCPDPLIDVVADPVDDRNDMEEPGPAKSLVTSEA